MLKITMLCESNPTSTLRRFCERAHQQPRAHQHHHRQRHLRHHQRVPRAPTIFRPHAPSSPSSFALLQRRRQIHARAAKRRRDAEKYSREQRNRNRESQHAHVDARRKSQRPRLIARNERNNRVRAPVRKQNSRACRPARRASRSPSIVGARSAARPAPSASRTAISFCRAAARASISPATFAHAISKIIPTASISTYSGSEYLVRVPVKPVCADTNVTSDCLCRGQCLRRLRRAVFHQAARRPATRRPRLRRSATSPAHSHSPATCARRRHPAGPRFILNGSVPGPT